MGEKSEGRRRREEFGFEGLEGITSIFSFPHFFFFRGIIRLD
jgi:hypothetical protein